MECLGTDFSIAQDALSKLSWFSFDIMQVSMVKSIFIVVLKMEKHDNFNWLIIGLYAFYRQIAQLLLQLIFTLRFFLSIGSILIVQYAGKKYEMFWSSFNLSFFAHVFSYEVFPK